MSLNETPTRARARARRARAKAARAAGPILPQLPDTPDADLSRAAAALLFALADPDTWKAPVDARCVAAGISRAQYFRLMRDPKFERKRRDAQLEALRSVADECLHDLRTSAKLPGKDGHADRRLLLEMLGYYEPGKKLTVVDATPRIEGDLPDEELVWWYLEVKWPQERWVPGVLQRYKAGTIQPRKPAAEEIEP